MICYIAGNFEAGNSLNLAVWYRLTFASNSALLRLLPSEVIDFAMLPAERFCRKTVSFLVVMLDLEVTNESTRCWKEMSSSITMTIS